MNFNIVTIQKAEGNDYTITMDGLSADHLTVDEVLGVFASILFRDDGERPLFMRTKAEEQAWEDRLKSINPIEDENASY